MENGYIILGLIALLFLSIYGFSYLSVAREKMNQKKQQQKELEKAQLRRQARIKNQELIDERVRKFNERKEEIQHELMLLKKMKEKQKVS
ncbi:hypothetical protein FPF71_10695 [Algibacter amylolyticus]|uniref:Uncharacterized protein n=1 Tax=Algibacter amylolyticus TaxID=1608400 RepID=A0A5M7B9T8_9FLAO|nr:hypothetical protein [Algibacter amylolyticus]KAA5824075.1 hypothetical protein F2B50_10695 [Algibacter amylolyticus]MBB5269631.1 Na+-translocating ferredoxin:NAD+ oxidoreductase RnfG subunit [Algibacter amylolyticus]TSJ74552.1 hypothetical protein FPF71_10695 [Algibacter amylolyticus]